MYTFMYYIFSKIKRQREDGRVWKVKKKKEALLSDKMSEFLSYAHTHMYV